MTFDEYAKSAIATAKYPLLGRNMMYPAAKLSGEAGELLDKIGKHWRNNYQDRQGYPVDASEEEIACWGINPESLTGEQRAEIIKELGDVLWYVNALAIELGTTLEYVARTNVVKITDRRARGVICSTGDNR